jgi:hypothetical protein
VRGLAGAAASRYGGSRPGRPLAFVALPGYLVPGRHLYCFRAIFVESHSGPALVALSTTPEKLLL